MISHTCWLETPLGSISLGLEKPTSCPKPGCATKPGAICPSLGWYEELPAFSGVFPRGCAPGAVLRAFASGRGSLTGVSWGSSSLVCQSQAAWWEGETRAGREGGGGVRVLQPQTERAGFFPFYFLFFLFPHLKEKKISKQPQNSQGHLKKSNKALWQRPHSMPGACCPELGAS